MYACTPGLLQLHFLTKKTWSVEAFEWETRSGAYSSRQTCMTPILPVAQYSDSIACATIVLACREKGVFEVLTEVLSDATHADLELFSFRVLPDKVVDVRLDKVRCQICK